MHNVIIDIGANHGEFCFEIAKRNPQTVVLAFEPEPHLFNEIKKSTLSNIKAFDIAISSHQGMAHFNVSHQGDWGVSSLLNLNTKNIENDNYWKKREDLKHFDEVISVKTDTLEAVLSKEKFDEISFIKIDTQGFDLIALKSTGKFLKTVKAGMIEAVSTPDKSLYSGDECDLYHALNFLYDNNFKICRIKSNDEACNEMNIYFCRSDVSIQDIEQELKLKNLDIYDGKDYCFFPSNHFPTTIIPFSSEKHISKDEAFQEFIKREFILRNSFFNFLKNKITFVSLFNYQRLRLLSHLTFGKTKKHYRKKYKQYFREIIKK